ncbi:hypothetical protein RRF57_005586 [Xylaria bambusicola]|uniref:Uncharacterized protein n=1 Tax=Xylaria bambusicola TaxID=326684 RepID=A0AAN7Z9C5_9PEZI
MAKDKKGKSDSKKQKLAEKKQKQEKKAQKKEKLKAAKLDGSDAEDVDLDAVLAEYKKQQELFLKVTETVSMPLPNPVPLPLSSPPPPIAINFCCLAVKHGMELLPTFSTTSISTIQIEMNGIA